MSTLQIVCLAAIVAAFILFAAGLAWGEYQTRGVTRRLPDSTVRQTARAMPAPSLTNTDKSSAAPMPARWPEAQDDRRLQHIA
ncbi:MAG TPA: hypothetical protein VGV62_14260 [Xanthobacteraceae bacterium]|nr:hypothetical protein [Xanthobacteraceae bacterium]